MSWLSRTAVRLVPAERRDWAEGLWAEADQVPSGVARLAWRAGGVRLIVQEARLVHRVGRLLGFAMAAAWVAWVAWPGSASNAATAVSRLDVVTVLPVLAGLPLLVRRLRGPAALSRLARVLRVGVYAAVLVLTVAKASIEQVAYNPAVVPRLTNSDASVPALDGMIFTWLAASVFLLVVAVYVAVILVMTARRSRVAPVTLAVGTGAGLALGTVMYALMPLGLAWSATSTWLPGSAADPVVLLAWALLLGAPVVAGSVAARYYREPDNPEQVAKARVRQRVAAAFLTTGIGALMVTVLGTGTVALMPRAGWLLRWLYPGQHLLAAVAANRELTASLNADNYGTILLVFPVIGLVLGLAAGYLAEQPGPPPDGEGGPAAPGPEPWPDPSDRQLAVLDQGRNATSAGWRLWGGR